MTKIKVEPNTEKNISIDIQKPPFITIWIHGTVFLKKPLFHELFQQNSVLNLAIYMNKKFYPHKLAELLYEQDPEEFPLETLYAFGWSGKLSASARFDAAKTLYNQLLLLIKKYKAKWNTYPSIRIIAHSHGANVALNLAFIEQMYQQGLKIHTLLLLACPVQKETVSFAMSKQFEHLYSLYSPLDIVQIIAPQQGTSKLPFSKRIFPPHSNLVQAKVRLNGKAMFHTEFTSELFIRSIPSLLRELQAIEKDYTSYSEKKVLLHITSKKKKNIQYELCNIRKRYPTKKKTYVYDLLRKKNFLPIYL
ncbi:MAG TPA: hypothetical protein VL201_04920 [Patescibacteria group bacterium]|jgi:hypothetical protein|nr:hypothetical protein [Patescibacteria group bacterium]